MGSGVRGEGEDIAERVDDGELGWVASCDAEDGAEGKDLKDVAWVGEGVPRTQQMAKPIMR